MTRKFKKLKFILVALVISTFLLSIFASHFAIAEVLNFDLVNLRNQNVIITKSYDIIKILEAWQRIKEINPVLSSIAVGIIDTGMDRTHQEFNTPNVNIDAPSSALVDSRPAGHGTQVAGIIGANNVLGSGGTLSLDSPQMNGIISGVLKENQYKLIIENKNFATSTSTQTIGIFIALENVLKKNPQIINLSLTLEKCSDLSLPIKILIKFECAKTDYEFFNLDKIFQSFFNSNPDKLFIASAGNEDANFVFATPAHWSILMPNVISVGATDLNDERATFPSTLNVGKSNFGIELNISAPGLSVYTPKPGDLYENPLGFEKRFNGTSASAPMVTGVAGLIRAINPGLSPAQIKQILVSNADPIQTDKPIGGRLNALKAVCDPLVGLNCVPTPPPQPSNTWQSVGPMSVERAEHTSTLLNDGRVLITGGFKGAGSAFSELSSAEVFNPQTNTFSSVGNMTTPRAFHTATLLPNGKVLIVGGTKDGSNTILNSAELFDPQTNAFNSVGNLNQKRFSHTADILPDGKVLIAGGFDGQQLKSTEIFDLSTNTFSPGSDMIKGRANHASAKLNDGRILLVNGLQTGSLMIVEIYDPNANSFALATSSVSQLGLGAVTLPTGNVFISGSTLFSQPAGLGAEIFHPTDNSFTEVGPMLFAINGGGPRLASVLLDDGTVLITGGAGSKAQIFNPQTNVFSLTGDLNIPRLTRHRLTLFQDGRALLTGGQLSLFGFVTTNGAEVFKP